MNETEKATVAKMIAIYCRKHHNGEKTLCGECKALLEYAKERLNRCCFADKKPSCRKCNVHCYNPKMKTKIVEVMRYAGPRMIFKYPIDALRHLFR